MSAQPARPRGPTPRGPREAGRAWAPSVCHSVKPRGGYQ